MLMGEALVARLKEDSAVAALVGARVFWDVRPQDAPGNALPAVVLQTIGGERPQHLDGFADMATAIVQASCFAVHKGEARELAEAVIAATVPEAEVGDVVFWRGDTTEPRDLGNQEDTRFIHNAQPDLTLRWGRPES